MGRKGGRVEETISQEKRVSASHFNLEREIYIKVMLLLERVFVCQLWLCEDAAIFG